jgi:hypothetical protein
VAGPTERLHLREGGGTLYPLACEVVKHFSFFAGGGVHLGICGDDRLDASPGLEVCGGLEL